MLIPRSLSRLKLTVLLGLLAVVVGLVVYLTVVSLSSGSATSVLVVPSATFGGDLDSRLSLPDPAQVFSPAEFDSTVGRELQDESILPASDGQRPNPQPFSPLPVFAIKRK